jgi:hypothetical protein
MLDCGFGELIQGHGKLKACVGRVLVMDVIFLAKIVWF